MATEKEKNGASGKQYKRSVRNIIVNRPMQREFSLILIALLMLSTLAIGFVIHDTLREAAVGGGFRFGKINPYEVLSEVKYSLIMRVTGILFVTLIVTGVFGIFFLHRVAGPVHRFRMLFMHVNEGNKPAYVKLREGDFFGETAEEINIMMRTWKFERQKTKEIEARVDKILASKPSKEIEAAALEMKEIIQKEPSRKAND